jgi:hypothetical protein
MTHYGGVINHKQSTFVVFVDKAGGGEFGVEKTIEFIMEWTETKLQSKKMKGRAKYDIKQLQITNN